MAAELQPGPEDPSLLTLQHEHRSELVWEDADVPKLVRTSVSALFQPSPLDPRVLELFQKVGFYGVYMTGKMRLDHSLITSLVERWRQETHSFHLPVGEATITLQDVAVLWGMPIDGNPVIALDHVRTKQQQQQLCLDLLGFEPLEGDLDGETLRMPCISRYLDQYVLPPDCDIITLHQYTRCKLLQMIGFVFGDKSSIKVKLWYLELIRGFDEAANYSWGTATLGTLYRELCNASKKGVTSIAGPVQLIQLWAWEHLPGFRPILNPNHLPPLLGPRACVDFERVASHTLKIFRDQLDYLMDWEFVWQPYSDVVINSLPDYCLRDRDLWCIFCPLINFDVVELHIPQRVRRQFELLQDVPPQCDTLLSLHRSRGRTGLKGCNWSQEHATYIGWWNNRASCTIHGPSDNSVMHYNSEYMLWYLPKTRRLIGNPAHRPEQGVRPVASLTEFAVRGLHHIHDVVIGAIDTLQLEEPRARATFEEIRDYTSNALRYMNEERRIAQPFDGDEEQNEQRDGEDEYEIGSSSRSLGFYQFPQQRH